MRHDQVSAWLSDARFRNYLDHCAGDHDKAVALYNWNAGVSAAFLEVLYHVEVLLRNAIDRQFPAIPHLPVVAIWSHEVWLTDPAILEDGARERVNEGIARLTRENRLQTRDRVIASLGFGFWCTLFSGRYEQLWRSHLHKAFPNGSGRRKQVNDLLQSILRFRNRVAHHEALFALDLEGQHEKQLTLSHLIDAEAREYIENLSRVPTLLENRP